MIGWRSKPCLRIPSLNAFSHPRLIAKKIKFFFEKESCNKRCAFDTRASSSGNSTCKVRGSAKLQIEAASLQMMKSRADIAKRSPTVQKKNAFTCEMFG